MGSPEVLRTDSHTDTVGGPRGSGEMSSAERNLSCPTQFENNTWASGEAAGPQGPRPTFLVGARSGLASPTPFPPPGAVFCALFCKRLSCTDQPSQRPWPRLGPFWLLIF